MEIYANWNWSPKLITRVADSRSNYRGRVAFIFHRSHSASTEFVNDSSITIFRCTRKRDCESFGWKNLITRTVSNLAKRFWTRENLKVSRKIIKKGLRFLSIFILRREKVSLGRPLCLEQPNNTVLCSVTFRSNRYIIFL